MVLARIEILIGLRIEYGDAPVGLLYSQVVCLDLVPKRCIFPIERICLCVECGLLALEGLLLS